MWDHVLEVSNDRMAASYAHGASKCHVRQFGRAKTFTASGPLDKYFYIRYGTLAAEASSTLATNPYQSSEAHLSPLSTTTRCRDHSPAAISTIPRPPLWDASGLAYCALPLLNFNTPTSSRPSDRTRPLLTPSRGPSSTHHHPHTTSPPTPRFPLYTSPYPPYPENPHGRDAR